MILQSTGEATTGQVFVGAHHATSRSKAVQKRRVAARQKINSMTIEPTPQAKGKMRNTTAIAQGFCSLVVRPPHTDFSSFLEWEQAAPGTSAQVENSKQQRIHAQLDGTTEQGLNKSARTAGRKKNKNSVASEGSQIENSMIYLKHIKSIPHQINQAQLLPDLCVFRLEPAQLLLMFLRVGQPAARASHFWGLEGGATELQLFSQAPQPYMSHPEILL